MTVRKPNAEQQQILDAYASAAAGPIGQAVVLPGDAPVTDDGGRSQYSPLSRESLIELARDREEEAAAEFFTPVYWCWTAIMALWCAWTKKGRIVLALRWATILARYTRWRGTAALLKAQQKW